MQIAAELGKNSYTITIARGSLPHAGDYMNLDRKVLVVTDSGVPAAYAQTVAACCRTPVVVTVPQGMLPMCGETLPPRVRAVLQKLGLPTACQMDADTVWQAMAHDKKLSGGTITVVCAEKAGSFQLRSVPLETLKETVYTFLSGKA